MSLQSIRRFPGLCTSAFKAFVAVSLTLAACLVSAQVQQIPANFTTLTSTADRMISYRSQNHMWQTADGATHVVINRGPGLSGQSLTLFSTFDGGSTWVNSGVNLPKSNGSSTSDGYLVDNRLFVTYDVGTGIIRAAELQYDAVTTTWTLQKVETVFSSGTNLALTPAVAPDALGRRWLTFTHQDTVTLNFSIKMMVKASADAAWADTGLIFGTVDNVSNERSGRPVTTRRGVGVVYTVKADTFWAERNNKWALNANWNKLPVYKKQTPSNDPYGTHFSVIVDASSNVHLASVDGGKVVYSRWLIAQNTWTTRVLTDDIKANYLQATIVDGKLVIVTNSYTNLSVYQSSDNGASFTRTHALTHPPPVGLINYDRPRLETPGISTSPVPVLQQYVDGKVQRAMFFAVPISPTPP